MKTQHDTTLTDLLRKAIRESGQSMRHIAGEAGLERASLSRFACGRQSLRLDRADALCRYFGIRHELDGGK